MLIDTHCHVDPGYFPEGTDAVLDRARAVGVKAFVVIGVGENLEPARFAADLASRVPDVWSTVGVHPHDASVLDAAMEAEMEQIAAKDRVCAIGEIGLDYHYMRSPKEKQQEVFRQLIALAVRTNKPIVVHTREAPEDTLSILEEEGASRVGGVIHCFSEDRPFAERALNIGFDISFSGIVTFKNAKAIHEVAAWAPLDRILVETDSPYLAPIPMRGKRCEPAYVVHTARRVAELRGMDFDTLVARTGENAQRRFGLH